MVARSASLVAAAALLLGLPQCAIDDRDLEETDGDGGGSGGANGGTSAGKGGTSAGKGGTSAGKGGTGGADSLCAVDSDDTECTVCTKNNCCDMYEACLTSSECAAYVTCGSPCADTSCLEACDSQYPEGSALFYAIVACGLDQCPDLCAS